MILPRLSGVHVPKCIAVGDFAAQPFIVMEWIAGPTCIAAARRIAVAIRRGGGDRRENRAGARRPAPPARDPSRHQAEQHHVPAERRSRAARFRPLASRATAGSDAGGVPPAVRHGALYVAGTVARHPQRSAQRPVRARRPALFLFHRRAPLRRKRDVARHAPAALARSRCRRAGCAATIRLGCRRSCCAVWRSNRATVIRRRRNLPSI